MSYKVLPIERTSRPNCDSPLRVNFPRLPGLPGTSGPGGRPEGIGRNPDIAARRSEAEASHNTTFDRSIKSELLSHHKLRKLAGTDEALRSILVLLLCPFTALAVLES
jgi:hypothetical protein